MGAYTTHRTRNDEIHMIAFFVFIIGVIHVVAPRASWYMSVGWKFRDAEPSDAYLALSRLGGGIAAVIALIVMIASIFHGA
jgi:hypothetical protein